MSLFFSFSNTKPPHLDDSHIPQTLHRPWAAPSVAAVAPADHSAIGTERREGALAGRQLDHLHQLILRKPKRPVTGKHPVIGKGKVFAKKRRGKKVGKKQQNRTCKEYEKWILMNFVLYCCFSFFNTIHYTWWLKWFSSRDCLTQKSTCPVL